MFVLNVTFSVITHTVWDHAVKSSQQQITTITVLTSTHRNLFDEPLKHIKIPQKVTLVVYFTKKYIIAHAATNRKRTRFHRIAKQLARRVFVF